MTCTITESCASLIQYMPIIYQVTEKSTLSLSIYLYLYIHTIYIQYIYIYIYIFIGHKSIVIIAYDNKFSLLTHNNSGSPRDADAPYNCGPCKCHNKICPPLRLPKARERSPEIIHRLRCSYCAAGSCRWYHDTPALAHRIMKALCYRYCNTYASNHPVDYPACHVPQRGRPGPAGAGCPCSRRGSSSRYPP